MTEAQRSWPAEVFDRLYAERPDPWQLASSAYEAEKYQATLAALDGRQFRAGLEIGCSIGILTRRLAGVCNSLLGIDFAEAALAQARRNCADLPHVGFRQARIPLGIPAPDRDGYDLIVLSEVLYFLYQADIQATAATVRAALSPNGVILLVNYLGATDSPSTGEQAAEIFIAACAPQLTPALQRQAEGYRLDRLQRRGSIPAR